MGVFFSGGFGSMQGPDYFEPGEAAKKTNFAGDDGWLLCLDPLLLSMNRLLKVGNRRTLEQVDLGHVADDMTVRHNVPKFASAWKEEMAIPDKDKRSLLRALLKSTGCGVFVMAVILFAVTTVSQYVFPIIQRDILAYLTGERDYDSVTVGWLVAGVFLSPVITALTSQHTELILSRQGVKFSTGMIGNVFEKATSISYISRIENEGGVEVIFDNDITNVSNFLDFVLKFIFAPVQLALGFYLAYLQMGTAVFYMILVVVAFMPILGLVGALLGMSFAAKRENTQKRVQIMKEVIGGIRMIKYYAWEVPFQEKLLAIRMVDLKYIVRIYMAFSLFFGMSKLIVIVMPVVIFYAYITSGNAVTVSNTFTMLYIIGLINQPVQVISSSIQQIARALVSIRKIKDFLSLRSEESYVVDLKDTRPEIAVWFGGEDADKMDTITDKDKDPRGAGASFAWLTPDAKQRMLELAAKAKAAKEKEDKDKKKDREHAGEGGKEGDNGDVEMVAMTVGAEEVALTSDTDSPEAESAPAPTPAQAGLDRELHTLRDVQFSLPVGSLTGVVGPVGCGKTTLLSAMLGDLVVLSGQVGLNGTLAYHQQEPFILNDTIRENILIGQAYDEKRFNRVLEVSALGPDLEVLSGGLETEIGEKGINLSGGQKARISFARCLYSDADILLLDDPLSAVDANVCDVMFNKALCSFVMKEQPKQKTIVLVTHQVQVLSRCDNVIVLNRDGSMRVCCPYGDLKSKHGIDLADLEAEIVQERARRDSELAAEAAAAAAAATAAAADSVIDDSSAARPRAGTLNTLASVSRDSQEGGGGSLTPGRYRSNTSSLDQAQEAAEAMADVMSGQGASLASVDVAVGVALDDQAVAALSQSDKAGAAAAATTSTRTRRDSAAVAVLKEQQEATGRLLEDEDRETGILSSVVWWYYIEKGGWWWFVLVVILYIVAGVTEKYSEFWLSQWGMESLDATQSSTSADLSISRQTFYLNIYAALRFGGAAVDQIAFASTTFHAYNCCAYFYHAMVRGLLRAPISYFDVTPSGRILNRTTSDIQEADAGVSAFIGLILNMIIGAAASVGTIVVLTNGTFLLLLLPLLYIYYTVQLYFRKAQTDIKRLGSIARTPVYTCISQSLSGVVTLRAFRVVDAFSDRLAGLVNVKEGVEYVQLKTRSWLNLRLSLMGATMCLFVISVATYAGESVITKEYVAVALQAALTVPFVLGFLVGILTECERLLASVERIRYYAESLPIEEPSVAEMLAEIERRGHYDDEENGGSHDHQNKSLGDRTRATALRAREMERVKREYAIVEPPADWPQEGKIEFRDVHMGYRNGPLILKGLSCEVAPKQKVGICGRTGSGKSSCLVALFRIEKLRQGQILIDGVDLSTVPVATLRSRLVMVPQDPALFSASVRYNIDPTNAYTDSEIWEALSVVSLTDTVRAMDGGLDAPVTEGGSNLSVGQRQLVCFARALLRKPKVVVMDEATAAVDNRTDELIQAVLKDRLKDCTVLTIAHRLNTIVDSDKLMVLHEGTLGEWDTPDALKSKKDGIFAEMWSNFEQSHQQ